jgi:hypothetical protein
LKNAEVCSALNAAKTEDVGDLSSHVDPDGEHPTLVFLSARPHHERMKEHGALLKAVKMFHTLAWFTIEACMLYVLYSGLRGQSDRRAGLAASVVALETLVFAANGFHCPLTAVARNLGDSTGSVTDIYLPQWLARNLPAIHVPLIAIAIALHWRNLSTMRRG